ncbi:hypothetical protein [Streptomyces sp. NPDC056660]|uniref:hypothetical protein n=1 Tax=Streptomyces sp. NPDC056660 TaxID=3345897 RepID=UPI003693BF32
MRPTGEQDVKGILKPGYYGDLAVLSDDFFAVPGQDIPHIESLLTVTGARPTASWSRSRTRRFRRSARHGARSPSPQVAGRSGRGLHSRR